MKFIKALIALFITISITLCFAPAQSADAETLRYAYAPPDSKVYLCSDKNADSALFIIPQTYCVEILAEEGSWYYAKYAEDNGAYRAVYGYCLKSELIKINEPLENTYLHYTIKLTFSADSSTNLLPAPVIELNAAYYGEYELGKTTLSYVYCGDKFGYVTDKVENYPLNDIPQQTVAQPAEQPDNSGAMIITAIVITAAAAAAIIILYFSSKKKPT